MVSLFNELKRRNVFKVAGFYAVVAWLLMQLASTLEDSLNLPVWFDGVITASLFIGFPIALLLAWAFEMTPEGVRKTESDENHQPESSNKWFEFSVVIGLVAVISLSIWQQFFTTNEVIIDSQSADEVINPTVAVSLAQQPALISANSIAVLPFSDLSQDGDQTYFSDGMAEEILNVLVRVSALQVTSRTSAFRYKNSDLRIPEIAEELKVRHVLEGSVRKSGDTLRITAQLIDASNDKHLWSETYDRPLTTDNIFAIQDEISNAIVQALSSSLQLEGIEKITVNKTTDNITAYELYLKARPLFLARDDLDLADEYIIKAIELDEDFAQAWEMRAALQFLMVDYGYTDNNAIEQRLLAEKFALKALSINPKSALAKSTLANIGSYKADGSENYSIKTIDLFNESIAIDPNIATSYNWRGLSYAGLGMLDKALLDFKRCLELEPLYSACYSNVMTSPLTLKSDQAEVLLNDGLGKDIINIQYLDLPWLAKNRKESLFKIVVNQKENLGGWGRAEELYQAYLHPQQDHRQLIDDVLAFHKSSNPDDPISVQIKMILVPIGAYELAPDAATMWGFGYQDYRQSDEFKAHVRDSGIYGYWQEKGFPPQCKPIGADDFECD